MPTNWHSSHPANTHDSRARHLGMEQSECNIPGFTGFGGFGGFGRFEGFRGFTRSALMKFPITIVAVLVSAAAFAQAPVQTPAPAAAPAAAQTPPPPATETVAPDIPGVVAGGTKVQVVKEGFQGTEGPHGLPDGSLLFTETAANRITKIAPDGTTSTFLENTNGSNGLAFDA